MAKRYAIWDKQSPVITPVGEILTAEQWIARRPVMGLDSIVAIVAAGEVNGALASTLGQMRQMAEANGCDFSDCTTNEEVLQRIEDFEDEMNAPAENTEPTAEERIAAALEYQNMMAE